MSTTIQVTVAGKPCFTHRANRRLNEDEVHAIVEDGLIGIDKSLAEVHIIHEFHTKQ